MKKFIMITPLQPVKPRNFLKCSVYEAVGNSKLVYNKETRFPLTKRAEKSPTSISGEMNRHKFDVDKEYILCYNFSEK